MIMFYRKYGKRFVDFVVALSALILLSPLLFSVALLVKIKLGSPVIFKQKRPGMNEKIFTMYKFRTMNESKDDSGQTLPDAARLTRFGTLLRSTSLDELPELWNIVCGHMAIIGPRPLLVDYLALYDAHQKRRHEVRPGLSGLAQVNGRNGISWEEKFNYDIEYIDNISFLMDCKIVGLSMKSALFMKNINSSAAVTMEPFRGKIAGSETDGE